MLNIDSTDGSSSVKIDSFISQHLVTFEEGDEILVSNEDNAVRFLLISGNLIGEPVARHGPAAMKTGENLRIAFEENRNGTFIKYKE